MNNWYMLTLMGEDKKGIVAAVTRALFERDITLGETSMLRLGGNFTIMMMVSDGEGAEKLEAAVRPVARELGLRFHIDPIAGGLHRHQMPNIQVRVHGADRPGIVAQVTGALARTGFNILELESDVAGAEDKPVYIMNIQGYCDATLEAVEEALRDLTTQGIEVDVSSVETLIG